MYIVSPQGAAVKIYSPHDCINNCFFCKDKSVYVNTDDFDLNKVIKSMEKINKLTPKCDFIITGGEPMMSMAGLERILMSIDFMNLRGANHKVFIETTLPVKKQDIYTLNRWKNVITRIDVARHVKDYVVESNDILFSYLRIPVRIVCVLPSIEEAQYAYEIIDRFKDYQCIKEIQFRDNFTDVTFDNLYNMMGNKVLKTLTSLFSKKVNDCEFEYTSCSWTCKIDKTIQFYRQMANPNFESALNEINIKPDGSIDEIDLAQYKESLK